MITLKQNVFKKILEYLKAFLFLNKHLFLEKKNMKKPPAFARYYHIFFLKKN